MDTVVELLDVNGEWWNLTSGDRGVWLGTDPKGLYDPPVKVVYEEPGNYPGARFLNARVLRRDIVFGVEILNDGSIGPNSWLSRDSEWRKAWAFDRDCLLYVTTPDSGTRYLRSRLGESIEVSMFHDPKLGRVNRAAMVVIAGDPFWYEEDVVYSATTTTDTTFDPNPLPWPWPQEALPTETLNIVVDPIDGRGGLNPTDQPIFLKWTAPGSTEAPALPYVPGIPWLGAPNSPAVIWTIPDYSFDDPEQANRRIRLPGLIGGLRTNEVQRIYIDGRPTGGTFTLGFGVETTSGLAYNATPAAIKAALEALAAVVFNDVAVEQAPATNEVQTIVISGGGTGGTFTLTADGQTTAPISVHANAFDIYLALIALPNIGWLDPNVTEQLSYETQLVQLNGEPTGGTFTLTLDGHTTTPLAWNADIFTVSGALGALPNIGAAQVEVEKNIFNPYSPYEITFRGPNLGGLNIDTLSGDASGLSGGAGMGVTVTTKTQGARPYKVTFQGELAGINVPQLTANASGITGGTAPAVTVTTNVEGSRPWVVTFVGNLSGVDVPQMTINTAGLTGGSGVVGYVRTGVEGHTYPAENVVIDSDPRVEQLSSESVSPIWARMNGVRFRNPVPPYTKSKTFEVTVSGTVPGQMITLRIPRPWTRPWGLE